MAAVHDDDDWRNSLQPDSRSRIVNKIVDTLRRSITVVGEEGEREIRLIAARFETRIYNTATSQSDYLRRISLKMLVMESQHPSIQSASGPSIYQNDANTNLRPGGSTMAAVHGDDDWRNSLQPDSRSRIVNKMVDKMRRHLTVPGEEGEQKIRLIATRLETETYNAATSQLNYLRQLSLKMLRMESRHPSSQSASGRASPFNAPPYDEY